jgi:hypothetical protein
VIFIVYDFSKLSTGKVVSIQKKMNMEKKMTKPQIGRVESNYYGMNTKYLPPNNIFSDKL